MAIRVGIVGFGYAGRVLHAPLIRSCGLQLAAIVTSRAGEIGAGYENIPVFSSLPDMLECRAADLVVIATPNHLHVEQAAAALQAGCHILIDKPPALHASDLDPLIELAGRYGKKAAVFLNRRFDSDYLTLKRLLQSRLLGDINAFHMRWDRFRPLVTPRWRERVENGGGVLLDLGSHMADQVIQLFGFPEWVQGYVGVQRPDAVADDTFEIQMGIGAIIVTLGVSSLSAPLIPRYVVQGSRGSFSKSAMDCQEQQLRDGMSPKHEDFGREPPAHWGQLHTPSGAPEPIESERGRWIEVYRQLQRSIEHGARVPASLEDARDVITLLEAARESSASGTRVEFPRNDKERKLRSD